MQTKDSDTVGATLLSIILEHKHSPRVLLTDNDASYGGKTFQEVLEHKKITLQENVVGDHNALGIIDRFAKNIKLIFSKMFVKMITLKGSIS